MLALHIAGPGLDVHRHLAPGGPPLTLGRDTECTVCLPDPERNISRRHLSVWNEGDQLHFHVLSAVNGVDIAAGELPPGARGILPPGEVMELSAFRLVATREAGEQTQPIDVADPWSEFERAAANLAPGAGTETVPGGAEEDPFGEWGFQSTFGPGSPDGLRGDALLPATNLRPFFEGLGVAPGDAGLTNGEMETLGRLTRLALVGLLQAALPAAAAGREVRSEDPTSGQGRQPNPLRMDTTLEEKLHYLFGGKSADAGFMPPDRAVAQMAAELSAHEQAMGDALREAAQKIVEEFAPDALKKRLLPGGPRFFESARAWDAFARDYAEQAAAGPGLAQKLLDRHFARAYAKALVRAKRNTPGRS